MNAPALTLIGLVLVIAVMAGCQPRPGHATPEQPYTGPEMNVSIANPGTDEVTVNVELTTPTGGYDLRLDTTSVSGETLRLFLTLVQPGHGEVVTQALVTHREQHVDRRRRPTRAEVYINMTRRGEDEETGYRLAAVAPREAAAHDQH